MKSEPILRWAMVLVAGAGLTAACSSSGRDSVAPETPTTPAVLAADEPTARPVLQPPDVDTDSALGPLTDGASARPTQVGDLLAGKAVPTNQWWSPALVGPGTGRLWAMPLTVDVIPGHGIDLRVPPVVAGENAIVSAVEPPLTLVADIDQVRVEDHGAFSVRLSASTTAGDSLEFTLAQGHPALTVKVPAGPIVLETNNPTDPPTAGSPGDTIEVATIEGRRWTIVTSALLAWSAVGTQLSADADVGVEITFVPRPDDAVLAWDEHAAALSANQVVTTIATMEMEWSANEAVETLRWIRASDGLGVVALLPHQWLLLDELPEVLGTYPTPRGPLRLVRADEISLRVPVAGFVPGIPSTPLSDDERSELIDGLRREEVGPLGAGSYFGSKHLARLANLVEVGRRLDVEREDLETALGAGVRDALTYSGVDDTRWLAYDDEWGGVVLHPPEFGSQDFNDHHFHYGYLIQAAATVAERDPSFVRTHGGLVDLLVADILGDTDDPAFPDLRVFNPYLGHSFASGFVPFADGNNQESSSEAVNAWWAVARWALVTNQAPIVDAAVAHYAIESLSARAYWLGELGLDRPDGYAHQSAGIVWGGKIDFATWFDARASAVIGIQLLPVNFGSIYRSDTSAASSRYAASAADLIWPDVAALDLAVAAPQEALSALDAVDTFDDGNTEAFSRYWIHSLDTLGPPRGDVTVDSPYGAAFGSGDEVTVVGVNPTDAAVTVAFRFEGREIGGLEIGPGASEVATFGL